MRWCHMRLALIGAVDRSRAGAILLVHYGLVCYVLLPAVRASVPYCWRPMIFTFWLVRHGSSMISRISGSRSSSDCIGSRMSSS